MYSKSTIKTLERRYLLLTLNVYFFEGVKLNTHIIFLSVLLSLDLQILNYENQYEFT